MSAVFIPWFIFTRRGVIPKRAKVISSEKQLLQIKISLLFEVCRGVVKLLLAFARTKKVVMNRGLSESIVGVKLLLLTGELGITAVDFSGEDLTGVSFISVRERGLLTGTPAKEPMCHIKEDNEETFTPPVRCIILEEALRDDVLAGSVSNFGVEPFVADRLCVLAEVSGLMISALFGLVGGRSSVAMGKVSSLFSVTSEGTVKDCIEGDSVVLTVVKVRVFLAVYKEDGERT